MSEVPLYSHHTVDFEGFGASKFLGYHDQICSADKALKMFARGSLTSGEGVVQGHLAHKKPRPPPGPP